MVSNWNELTSATYRPGSSPSRSSDIGVPMFPQATARKSCPAKHTRGEFRRRRLPVGSRDGDDGGGREGKGKFQFADQRRPLGGDVDDQRRAFLNPRTQDDKVVTRRILRSLRSGHDSGSPPPSGALRVPRAAGTPAVEGKDGGAATLQQPGSGHAATAEAEDGDAESGVRVVSGNHHEGSEVLSGV